ncbi:uncharacterized protein LOC144499271 [Mustelus asterias]
MKILIFCSFVSLVSISDTINLEIFQSPLKVLLNEDVLLKCKVTGYVGDTIDPQTVGVQWMLEGQTEVYYFIGGNHEPKRPGANISDNDLLKGDVSLYLSKVQLADEGRYTCKVIITPESAEQTSAMQVLARPNVHLSTQSITIQSGSEGSVRCDVTGFYPQQLDISWIKISKWRTENVSSESYTKHFVNNSDKTFNVSSQLRIRATMKDDGDKYRCVVAHSTFPDGFTIESVLSVTKSSNRSHVIAAIIGVMVLCITLAFGIFIWRRCSKGQNQDDEEKQSFLKKKSPDSGTALCAGPGTPETETIALTIGDMKKPDKIIAGEKTNLSWDVSVFSPREVTNFVTSVKRKGEQEAKKLFHWEIPLDKFKGPFAVTLPLNNVSDLCEKDDSFSAEIPELQRESDGSFCIPCSITLCPDVSKDDGAELIFEIKQEGTEEPWTKSTVLKVTAGTSSNCSSNTPSEMGVQQDGNEGTGKPDTADASSNGPNNTLSETGKQKFENEGTTNPDNAETTNASSGSPSSSQFETAVPQNQKEVTINPDAEVALIIGDMKKPDKIIAGEKTNLSWKVSVFSPREVKNFVTSVKRKGEQEAKKLFHWKIPLDKFTGPFGVTLPLNNVLHLCEKDDSFSAETPELQRESDGSFCILCSITLCPDVSKDDGAELIFEVQQEGTEEPWTKSTVLKVTADTSPNIPNNIPSEMEVQQDANQGTGNPDTAEID